MVKKQYCDFCGKDMDFELDDEIQIYNHTKEDNEFIADICKECKLKVLVFLKSLKKGVKK